MITFSTATSVNKTFRYVTARSPKRIEKFAKLVQKYGLHLEGGMMYYWTWRHNIKNIKALTIVTSIQGGTPIAAGILNKNDGDINTGIFVTPPYRRRGIGSEILKRLQTPDIQFMVGVGLMASVPFYTKYKMKYNIKCVF